MKTFLEFHEAVVDTGLEDISPRKLTKSIRTKLELEKKFTELKDQVKAEGLEGRYFIHICKHDEGKACISVPIKAGDTTASLKEKLTAEVALA